MTSQQIYNKVKKHLLTQKCKAINKNKMCLYRGPKKTKCAAGCLIPDALYKKSFEGQDIYELLSDYDSKEVFGFKLDDDSFALISGLQSVHDDTDTLNWKEALQRVAESYGLKP